MVKDRKIMMLSFVAAATKAIAGVMHIQLAPMQLSYDLGEGILFLAGGALQVFWALPVVRQWGRIWQIIGIAGTIVFVMLWFATHAHNFVGDTPGVNISGGGPIGNMSHGSPQDNITGSHFPRGPPPEELQAYRILSTFSLRSLAST